MNIAATIIVGLAVIGLIAWIDARARRADRIRKRIDWIRDQ
jgi:hypothetical protein